MVRRLVPVFAAVLALAAAAPVAAQSAHPSIRSPAAGSPERRAVLNALRPEVEAVLGGEVEFVVHSIRVGGGWAFVEATPQRPGGRAIRGGPDMDGVHTEAVLRRDGGGWVVVGSGVGSTDVWYLDWCRRTPRGLMDHVC